MIILAEPACRTIYIFILHNTNFYSDKQNIPVRLALHQYEIYNAHQKCFAKTGASSALKPLVIMRIILQCHRRRG